MSSSDNIEQLIMYVGVCMGLGSTINIYTQPYFNSEHTEDYREKESGEIHLASRLM